MKQMYFFLIYNIKNLKCRLKQIFLKSEVTIVGKHEKRINSTFTETQSLVKYLI